MEAPTEPVDDALHRRTDLPVRMAAEAHATANAATQRWRKLSMAVIVAGVTLVSLAVGTTCAASPPALAPTRTSRRRP